MAALLSVLAVVFVRHRDRSAVFVVEIASLEQLRVRIDEPARIEEAEALLQSGERTTVEGELRAGDGGFDAPRRWHLDPRTVRFTKRRRPELDALPSEIDEDLEHWLRDVREYAPWSSRIIARER